MVSLSPSTTFSSLSLFFHGPVSPGRFCLSSPRHPPVTPSPPRSLPPAPFCHSERSEESVFRPPVAPPALLVLFPPLSPLFFVLLLLPSSHIRSALFCPFLCFLPHSRLTPCPFTPHATIFSPSCVTTSNEDFLFPTHASRPRCPLPALFPRRTPPPSAGRHPPPVDARSPCALAPAYYTPPQKTFFLRVFRPCFCRKFLLYLSCRPLYKTYIFTNIYCHTITICMQENIACLGGASRGGGGVFPREPFFKGPRGLRNGFLWGSSARRNGRNGRNDRTGGRGRVAGRRNGEGNRFFGGPGPSSE